jgi:hypothetical protein
MTILTPALAPSLDTHKADCLYEELRPTLEPEHNGEFIVIHPGTGEYLVGKDGAALMRKLFEKFPDGTLQRRRIGPPTESDLRFVARLRMEQQLHELRAK